MRSGQAVASGEAAVSAFEASGDLFNLVEARGQLLFRQKVIRLLHDQGLLSQDRLELLDSWKPGHTGFSAHNRVTVSAQDKDGLERRARYLVRSPVSLERLEIDGAIVRYRHKRAHPVHAEAFDAHDFLPRVLMHVPAQAVR